MAWQFIVPAVASLLGNLAGGRAKGRQDAAELNLQRDSLGTQQYSVQQQALLRALEGAERGGLDRAQLDLARRAFAQQAPTARAQQAVRGDTMANAQDVQIRHPRATIPTITGGPRPSMLSGETRALGRNLSQQALAGQLAGDQFPDVPQTNFAGGVLPQPGQTPAPKANWIDKVLGVAAPIAGLAGAVGTGLEQSETSRLLQELLKQSQGRTPSSVFTPPLTPPPFNPNLGSWQGGGNG